MYQYLKGTITSAAEKVPVNEQHKNKNLVENSNELVDIITRKEIPSITD